MLIKQPDDKTPYLRRLTQLAKQSGLSEDSQLRAARALRNIETFLQGNEVLTTELNRHFQRSDDWAVLHDLRLELGGQVVYVEHLVLNSLLEGWVITGGQLADGVLIRNGAPCGTFDGDMVRAITNPFLECDRAVDILSRLLSSSRVRLPLKVGLPVRPAFRVLVMVPGNARRVVHGPLTPERAIISTTELATFFAHATPTALSLRALTRHVSGEVLRRIATEIADFHTGLPDWPLAHLAEHGEPRTARPAEPQLSR